MPVTLRTIIDTFMIEYPPPSDGNDYTDRYIVSWNKALSDFNFRASRRKTFEINVVSNTSVYLLPVDFVKIITVDLKMPSGIQQSEGGLSIPSSVPGYVETYILEGIQIRFIPIPKYNAIKNLWYGAGHVLGPIDPLVWEATTDYEEGDSIIIDDFNYVVCTTSGTSDSTLPVWPTELGTEVIDGTVAWTLVERSYGEMTMADVYIILLKAKVFMIRDTAAIQATGGLRYSLGELTIDRTRQGDFTNKAADNLNQQYLDEVKSRIGHLLSISYRQAEEEIRY